MAMFIATPGAFTGILVSGSQFMAPSGTNAAPGYSFIAAPSSGMWFTSGNLALASGGIDVLSVFSTGIRLGAGFALGFSSAAGATGNASDVAVSRLGAASLAVGNGTAADVSGTLTAATAVSQSANGATWTRGQISELLTIAAAATTDTTANLLPANSIIEAVVCRVTTVIPTAATFTVGDATIAARFATGISTAATTTAVGLTHVDQTGTSGPKQTAAAKIRITPNLTPGTATGVLRITVFYRQFVAPTS